MVAAAAAVGFTYSPAGRSPDRDVAAIRRPSGVFIASVRARKATVWAVGDGADGSKTSKVVARRIVRARPARFLYLGDVYEHGTAEEFAKHYAPVYGALARVTAPTPGNHDWPNHESGYDPYWKRVTGKQPPAFYAFSVAGWQLISANSEVDHRPGSAQVSWLRRTVRRPGTCRIAFFHRPRYGASIDDDDLPDMAPVWNALRGHVAIVLSGHEHDMQRLRPRSGIVELVSGGGGHGLDRLDGSYAGLAFGNDKDYGALRLRLRRGLARFAFVTASGRTLDSGTVRCRPLR